MTRPATTLLYDRRSGAVQQERVFADRELSWLYGTPLGLAVSELVVKRRWFSRLYGAQNHTARSRRKIRAFVETHQIDLSEVDGDIEDFRTFNEFFIRKLRPGARPIDPRPEVLISPADARVRVYPIDRDSDMVPAKGRAFTLGELCPDPEVTERLRGGTAIVLRLAPADYHRFGYVDDGVQTAIHRVGSHLHSVHPLSLDSLRRVFTENIREWCVLRTERFGDLLHVDVGALAVGRIVQHHPAGARVTRGQEKGYFEFGGSTVILVVPPGAITIDEDIVAHSSRGVETQVRYGERLGQRQ